MPSSQQMSVVVATEDDRPAMMATLLAAFTGDPFTRWLYPGAAQYFRSFPEMLGPFGGGAFEHGTAYRTADDTAVALWLPPGVSPDGEALGAVVQQGVSGERLAGMFGVFEQIGAAHPKEPHWYLPTIGVDPYAQGRGLGSALLAHALAIIDERHEPAYLESSNPINVPLYARFGFVPVCEIEAGDSVMTPMFRPAR